MKAKSRITKLSKKPKRLNFEAESTEDEGAGSTDVGYSIKHFIYLYAHQ